VASLIDYPCDMPLPLIESYSYIDQLQVRRNDVQVGPPRYSLLSEDAPTHFNIAFSFNEFEFRVFEAWYKRDLVYGSVSFNIDLDVGAGRNQAHECYLDDVYQVAQLGKRWRITVPLLAIRKVYETDACDIEQILFIANYGGLSSWLLAINNFSDVTIPESGLGRINLGTHYR
jgi:hypothetical protein